MDIDKGHSFIIFLYNSVNQSHIYTLPSPAVAKYSPIKRNKQNMKFKTNWGERESKDCA